MYFTLLILLHYLRFYDIMNAKAFIINYLKALADMQIKDQLPAYWAIITYSLRSYVMIKNDADIV